MWLSGNLFSVWVNNLRRSGILGVTQSDGSRNAWGHIRNFLFGHQIGSVITCDDRRRLTSTATRALTSCADFTVEVVVEGASTTARATSTATKVRRSVSCSCNAGRDGSGGCTSSENSAIASTARDYRAGPLSIGALAATQLANSAVRAAKHYIGIGTFPTLTDWLVIVLRFASKTLQSSKDTTFATLFFVSESPTFFFGSELGGARVRARTATWRGGEVASALVAWRSNLSVFVVVIAVLIDGLLCGVGAADGWRWLSPSSRVYRVSVSFVVEEVVIFEILVFLLAVDVFVGGDSIFIGLRDKTLLFLFTVEVVLIGFSLAGESCWASSAAR